jgi:hypothetical protein
MASSSSTNIIRDDAVFVSRYGRLCAAASAVQVRWLLARRARTFTPSRIVSSTAALWHCLKDAGKQRFLSRALSRLIVAVVAAARPPKRLATTAAYCVDSALARPRSSYKYPPAPSLFFSSSHPHFIAQRASSPARVPAPHTAAHHNFINPIPLST